MFIGIPGERTRSHGERRPPHNSTASTSGPLSGQGERLATPGPWNRCSPRRSPSRLVVARTFRNNRRAGSSRQASEAWSADRRETLERSTNWLAHLNWILTCLLAPLQTQRRCGCFFDGDVNVKQASAALLVRRNVSERRARDVSSGALQDLSKNGIVGLQISSRTWTKSGPIRKKLEHYGKLWKIRKKSEKFEFVKNNSSFSEKVGNWKNSSS